MHNVALSTWKTFACPAMSPPPNVTEDLIEPEVEVSPRGTIPAPTQPGRGYRIREDLIEKLTVKKETLTP